MEFTGERFLPTLQGEIAYEHWHRYAFALQLVAGKKVLDIACGEGYGAALMATSAGLVVGGDINPDSLVAAKACYSAKANLNWVRTSCDLLAFESASFDVVVSFETIEHIATQEKMLAEIKRVLKPDGLFCLSSPNKAEYSDARNYSNPFHIKELYRDELVDLLAPYFSATRWFHQKLMFHSAIWAEDRGASSAQYLEVNEGMPREKPQLNAEAMYFLVLCAASDDLLSKNFPTSFLCDPAETVYRSYENAVREIIRLNGLLAERERLITERDQLLEDYGRQIKSHLDVIAARDEMLELRTAQMLEREVLIQEREVLIQERDEVLALRTQQMEERERLIEERDNLLQERNLQIAALEKRLAKPKLWNKS